MIVDGRAVTQNESVSSSQIVPMIISVLALFSSGLTAWLTLLRRGNIKMTRPRVIYFGPDGGTNETRHPKVFLRALLFATAKQGRVLEAMYVRLSRGEMRQTFSIWVHGEDRLSRGSGLYVGEEGVLANHHFLLPRDSPIFEFREGKYGLEVFGQVFGAKAVSNLFTQEIEISASIAKAMTDLNHGVYFDWGPEASSYTANVEPLRPRFPQKHSPGEIDWENPFA